MTEKIFHEEKVTETNYFNIHQDWETPIAGFFIITPKRKIRTIDEFTDAEAVEYINLIRKLRQGMKEVLNIKDVYFFQNEDTKHNFHLWIFPRHDWMERFGRKIESVRTIMNYANENMLNQNSIYKVKLYVQKMRDYFSTE